ncbi:unnamed protein product [Owenia fusiformis]|uniref:Uncharacterized protein n=1 Tax=Owenia fusiformis TaxID=6347 RepID=A0A8J1TGH9_OWEFU|nr:unnamed protein product [Owenia fusiformis]
MGSDANHVMKMIQDAVLKICSQHVQFENSLEIDGIICLSPGSAIPDIVVKMHRTVLQSKTVHRQISAEPSQPMGATPPNPAEYNYTDYTPHPRLQQIQMSSTPSCSLKAESNFMENSGGDDMFPDGLDTAEESHKQSSSTATKRKCDTKIKQETIPTKQVKSEPIEEESDTITIEDNSNDDTFHNTRDNSDTFERNVDQSKFREETNSSTFNQSKYVSESNPAAYQQSMGGSADTNTYASQGEMLSPEFQIWSPDISSPLQQRKKSLKNTETLEIVYSEDNMEKMFRCPTCLKSFKDRSNCKQHLLIHTGVKPYTCDVCGKAFNKSQNLKTHQKRHYIGANIPPVSTDTSYMSTDTNEMSSAGTI